MFHLILVILAIGIIMGLINKYGAEFIGQPFLRIANIVAIICVVVYILYAFGIFPVRDVPVPQV